MTFLITGSTGTTGSRLARLLDDQGAPVRRAGRSTGADVRLDWADPTTHADALSGVRAVYLVAPPGATDPEARVLPFLEAARDAGVERIVLLGSSAVPVGSPGLGTLGARLASFVPHPVVLRPTWFSSNFTGHHPHADSVRRDGEIVSATGQGRIPFIDPGDIAAVAAKALQGEVPAGADPVLTGPRTLSFDEVAATLTEVTGRPVHHRHVDVAELSRIHQGFGLPEGFADLLAGMDASIATGSEDRTTTAVQDITGEAPRSFRAFVTAALGAETDTRSA
ncbi:NAD(P)H-binding protein [Nocardiopsis sp. MG754419]|uniref:NAD(P)H-binding protein n=1 Tax=Nocardiopsis sp. MG754419 TaxID=2259865 RepID=UPI001BACCE0E|nr:NAD(P)H-binding protein [Nocardiopsis sp. MG754419]MBR8743951.1 ergot alkaloid biosynthesis protein [Nocardiopsis sp. MG754419]